MRTFKHTFTALAVILGLAVAANAGYTEKAKPADAPKEFHNQTNCPVMGGKIDSTYYTDIQGQRVYHCCPMCSAKLKADPDKYFQKAAEEGVLFENIQTNCPVSGEKLEDKTVFTDYQGRRVYFCCKQCRGKFAADPDTYLKKLDEMTDPGDKAESETDKMEMKEHEEHGEQHN